ncbi:MAG: hypothetical protein ACTSPB_15765 [Candidatus Thorarchaeota archaeon]
MMNQIIGEESVCPHCRKALMVIGIDIGDGFLHDVCQLCGFKQKKNKEGVVVESITLVETIRKAEAKRKDEGRELK